MTMKTRKLKTYGMQQKHFKREVYSNTVLPQETKKHRIDNLTLHLKRLDKEKQKIPKISRRKEIMNIQAEISEKEMKETFKD